MSNSPKKVEAIPFSAAFAKGREDVGGGESVGGDDQEKHSIQGQGYWADVSPAWCLDGEGRPGTVQEAPL